MDWVKLPTGYHRAPAVAGLDDAAEVMLNRGRAYCGDAETGGFIPDATLLSLCRQDTAAKARRVASRLVTAGLWDRVTGGYRVVDWDDEQSELEALLARRRADADRKRRQRARTTDNAMSRDMSRDIDRDASRDMGRDMSRDGHVTVRNRELEGELDAACGSGGRVTAPEPPPLPPAVEQLRQALAGAGLTARWDRVSVAEAVELDALVAAHGVPRLVRQAQKAHRPDNPAAFAGAWLPGWRQLPTLVEGGAKPEKCDQHRLPQPCRSCAADRLVGGSR